MTDILEHIEASVMTLTFNRINKKNSITSAMYGQLADSLAKAKDDASIRVVVIQGHATIFTAGNDIADFLHRPPTTDEAPVFRFLHGIAAFPKPIVAAVCGPAVGVGTTLLLHCDLVYAGDNATFAMPFVNLGIVPEAASSLLLPQMFGYHRAAEALLLGEPLMAEAALAVGLVNKVLLPTETNDYAQTVAKKLAAKPLSSIMETKRLMKMGQMDAVYARMDEESVVFGRMLGEPAAKEAFSAFILKKAVTQPI